MNERVLILREAVVKITQMLTGKGIEVTQRGVNAYVQCDKAGRPIQVNLPYLPDNSSDELCMAIQGFLDHEVAHILFTDFALLEEANKAGAHSMLNLLEDARIEKCMAERFTGSGHNLTTTGKFFLDKYTNPRLEDALKTGDANTAIGALMVPLIRGMAGQFIFKEYMRDKMPLIQDVYDKIADLEPKIANVKSTRECLDLAKEIESRIRDKKDKGDPSDKGDQSEGDGSAGAEPQAGKGKSKTPEKKMSKTSAPSKDKDDEEENDSASSKSDDDSEKEGENEENNAGSSTAKGEDDADEEVDGSESEDEGENEGESAGGAGSAGDEDESEDEGETGSATSAAKDGGGPTGKEYETGDASGVWDAIDKECANGYDETISDMISNEAVTAAKSAPYLIYSKDQDVVEPLHVGKEYASRMFTDMASKVDHMVGPLQKDLERAISARSMATWESGRRSGRLHQANLSRLAVGDGRVFRRKHETTSKDVAVELVIDASGSMSGQKVHLATQAAYALSSVLERIGIRHEVICFTTGSMPDDRDGKINAQIKKLGRSFTRLEGLYMPVIKGFEERLRTDVKERFGWLPNSNILRNNIDGECIEIAARRLIARRESGKVMIVLSDGAPNAHGDVRALSAHLKKVIKDLSKSINVVGIGIMTDEVRHYYPKHVIINNVSELPDRVIKELRHSLVG